MEISKGSLTALVSAFGRAYHSLHDEPKIFDDFLAKSMMTEETFLFIGKSLAGSISFFDSEFAAGKPTEEQALSYLMKIHSTPSTLSRSRYTEDCLEAAVAQGLSQYVILGAGMDTFAFRKKGLLKKLQVYELDQPVTQDYKRNRLSELGWEIPEQLHLLPVDFSRDNLGEVLVNAGYDTAKTGFFNWLGVTYYLERSDVLSVLGRVAGISTPGSLIVFDYLDMDAFDDNKVSKRAGKMRELVRNAGEPMKTGFDPVGLEALLAEAGLQLVEDMGPDMIQKAYFDGRTDGYSAFEHFHIAKAKVI
jgi:methyltransferase (TIGR00027 family)